jgi:hypothetical protein
MSPVMSNGSSSPQEPLRPFYYQDQDQEPYEQAPKKSEKKDQYNVRPQAVHRSVEPAPRYADPIPETTVYYTESEEKADILAKLQNLERKGIKLSKDYGFKSSIDELRMELRRQTDIIESNASVNFMRQGLILCVTGIEYFNRRFNPVGANLTGWGESVIENIMDFDGIFERLHTKYAGSAHMEPEMELLFALAGSAFMFHLTNTLFKSAGPQIGNVLKENPNLMQNIFGAVQEAARRSNQPSMQQMPTAADMYQQSGVPVGTMQGPSFDIASLLSQIGVKNNQQNQNATHIGETMSQFSRAMGVPMDRPMDAKQNYRSDPPVNELFMKLAPKDQQFENRDLPNTTDVFRGMMRNNDDNLSVISDESERSIGHGLRKATITEMSKSPGKKNEGGGYVIKL